jgi:putative tryptophan/tyrosine transport system substrate-binding protein
MRRRDFITLISGTATICPLAAWAQSAGQMRRIGVLENMSADDPEAQARIGAFHQGLQDSGWSIGRNVRIDYRWATDQSKIPEYAAELVALTPSVILANANPSVDALLKISRDVPIVFVATTDPVGMGMVQSLSRPGGNATGFTTAEFGMSGKWLELLREIAPNVKRVAVLQDPTSGSSSIPQFAAMQAVAPSLRFDLVSLVVRDDDQIKHDITSFARNADAGLIGTRTGAVIRHSKLIIDLAAQLHLPAIYPLRLFVASGGLASYGPDIVDEYRLAALYVDRILKGEKPADLPVQAHTKFETLVNLKTAKALGLEVPATLLSRADEVIE